MKSVNIKEARLFEQWANTTLASVKWADLLQYESDKEIILKAWNELKASELYKEVWKDIQAMGEKIVNEKCIPEWNKISEEMKPIWEKINKLEKERAAIPEDWVWETEKAEELADLQKKMSELSDGYQKVTDEANKELSEYKDKRINEEKWGCFFLEDDEYDLIGKYAWFISEENN